MKLSQYQNKKLLSSGATNTKTAKNDFPAIKFKIKEGDFFAKTD